MKAIYFSGKAGGGKTAAALGIGLKLCDKGLKVSYFKPIGFRRGTVKKDDDDVLLMRDVLELPFNSATISPVTVNAHYLTARFLKEDKELYPRIEKAFKKCSEGYDVVLVDGSIEPYVGHNQGLDDFELATKLQTAALPIIRADDDFHIDQNLLYMDIWNDHDIEVIGTIFNNVSQTQWNKCNSIYKPLVEEKGFNVLGVVPCQVEISSPTVNEFFDVLNGELIASPEHMNRLVEDVVVGTMTIESALGYLRRAPNKALVTGGDRSDMALTALETSTSVIIFTGGLYPDVRVLSRAEEKGVPVILVHEDTYTTIENLQSVYRSIHPQNQDTINLVKKSIEKHVDWESVLNFVQK
ncbi:MAG: phosphotransacetylase family protein [Bacillota bacterium]